MKQEIDETTEISNFLTNEQHSLSGNRLSFSLFTPTIIRYEESLQTRLADVTIQIKLLQGDKGRKKSEQIYISQNHS